MTGKLAQSDSQYLRERTVEFTDAGNRILDHLLYTTRSRLSDIREPAVLVTHNLMPSDTLGLDRKLVLGIAADAGGKTSHTAILARAGEIPAVLGLSDISRNVHTGDEVIVDGNRGTVIVIPTRPRGTATTSGAASGNAPTSCSRSRGTCPRRRWTGSGFPSRRTSRCRKRRRRSRPRRGRHRAVPFGVPLHPAEPFPDGGRTARRLHDRAVRDGRTHA